MLRFSIYSPDSVVVVDNAPVVVSLAALPTNVVVVAYQIDQGSVEYNDRPRLRTPFTDPAPYQPFLNLWITAAQAPPLQLAQAKQVKVDLVEAIFQHKRRLPYAYGAWSYDAKDQSVANLDMLVQGTQVVSSDTTGLIASINAALAQIVNGANAMVTANNTSAPAVNSNFTSMYQGLQYNPDTWHMQTHGGYSSAAVFQYMAYLAAATVSGSTSVGASHVGNIVHQPLNAAAPQSIPAEDIYQALRGVAGRFNSLNTNRLAKSAAINALSTIAAVAAYDATTGWSF